MPRFYTRQPLAPQRTVQLENNVSHHMLRVLRLQPGETLTLFNGDGSEYLAILEGATRKQARVFVQDVRQPRRESGLRIHLGQGISRGERMDFVVQKSVELGVSSITPLLTRRTQVRLSSQQLDKKKSHWEAVLRSACEQAGRTFLPELETATELENWCRKGLDPCAKIVLDPGASGRLRDLSPTGEVQLLIGPEGGLEESELDIAEANGFQRIGLGPRVLRTETAALAALAAMQALWGDL